MRDATKELNQRRAVIRDIQTDKRKERFETRAVSS